MGKSKDSTLQSALGFLQPYSLPPGCPRAPWPQNLEEEETVQVYLCPLHLFPLPSCTWPAADVTRLPSPIQIAYRCFEEPLVVLHYPKIGPKLPSETLSGSPCLIPPSVLQTRPHLAVVNLITRMVLGSCALCCAVLPAENSAEQAPCSPPGPLSFPVLFFHLKHTTFLRKPFLDACD